jgi:hypothetical protein
MARVRALCGFCLSREFICSICFPNIRSAQALHKELPVGWYAHCDACHRRMIDGSDSCPFCSSDDLIRLA